MLTALVALGLLAAACGGSEDEPATAPATVDRTEAGVDGSDGETSTTPSTNPTTSTTSSTTAPEGSEPPSTTQTTAAAPDDGTSLIAERWALLGGWDGDSWFTQIFDDEASVPTEAGDAFTTYDMTGAGDTVTVSAVDVTCEPVGFFGPIFDDWADDGDPLAVRAGWNVQPRIPSVTDTPEAVYQTAIDQFAVGQGLTGSPIITQWARVDIQGDGIDEVFMIGESGDFDDWEFGAEGDYSFAIMRTVIEEEVQTAVLGLSEVDGEYDILTRYRFEAFLDLNNDGKLEIIVRDSYYEGAGTIVWEYLNDDLGPVIVLNGGCGV